MTSCICHKLGICTLTNPSVGDVIYFLSQAWNFKLVTDTGSHVTLRIHLIHSIPTFDTLSISYTLAYSHTSLNL